MKDYDKSPNFWFSCMPRLSLFRENTVKHLTHKCVIGETTVNDWTIIHSYDCMKGFEMDMIRELQRFFAFVNEIIEGEFMITVEFVMQQLSTTHSYEVPCFRYILHTGPDTKIDALLAMKLKDELPFRRTV